MSKTDTLVVGQGIAGSLVAFLLHKQRIPFKVIDPGLANTSSRIAAGMFTPVTGKRKTIDPRVAGQIDLAIHMYKEIGHLIGSDILHCENIYQVFHSAAERESVASKANLPDFKRYILPDPLPIPFLKQAEAACEITHSGWVDCETWLTGFGSWLQQQGALLLEEFEYAALQFNENGMTYKGTSFNGIIFCEGYRGADNPFFGDECIIPCKGNVFTIHCDSLQTRSIVKKDGIYLVQQQQNVFKAGATYQWNDASLEPDKASAKLLTEKLNNLLSETYTILDQKAGIRPTTKNREVIARQHPIYKRMFMLNGLGTKGILQGPWWASQLLKFYTGLG